MDFRKKQMGTHSYVPVLPIIHWIKNKQGEVESTISDVVVENEREEEEEYEEEYEEEEEVEERWRRWRRSRSKKKEERRRSFFWLLFLYSRTDYY